MDFEYFKKQAFEVKRKSGHNGINDLLIDIRNNRIKWSVIGQSILPYLFPLFQSLDILGGKKFSMAMEKHLKSQSNLVELRS